MAQSLILIINTLGGVFLFAILVRFLLGAAGADFYNPVSQALHRLTRPFIAPFRRVIPRWRSFDFSALVAALVFNSLATALMIVIANFPLDIGRVVSWSFVGVLNFILDIYFFGLLISIIASWVAPYSGNPILILVHQLLEPIQSVFRRFIPPLGGLDFSPIFIFLAIQIIEIMVVNALGIRLGLVPALVIGI